jgi:hypothetical protein
MIDATVFDLERAEQLRMAIKMLNADSGKVLITGAQESNFVAVQKAGCHFLRI